MSQIRPRVSVRFTIVLMIVALLAASLPVAAFAAGPATSAAAPAHDKGKAEKPGKPKKPGKPDKDAACTRKDVKDDAERGVKAAERWHLRVRTDDGKHLGVRRLEDGRCSPVIAIGLVYRVTAKVPRSLRSTLDGATVEVQHREEGDDTWKTVKEVPVGSDGRIRTSFRAREQHMNLHDYRVAVLAPSGAAAPAGVIYPICLACSPPTPATGITALVVNIVNAAGKPMNLQIPTAPSWVDSQLEWGQVEVGINDGETKAFIYVNAPPGIAAGFTMTNSPCYDTFSCAPRIPEWSCHTLPGSARNNTCIPDGNSFATQVWPADQRTDVNGNPYPVCTDVNPQITSGGVYTITLKPGGSANQTDFIRGYLNGPLNGIGTQYITCIFSTTTSDVDWFAGHPGHWLEAFLIAGVAVVLLEVLVAIATVDVTAAAIEMADERIPNLDKLDTTSQQIIYQFLK